MISGEKVQVRSKISNDSYNVYHRNKDGLFGELVHDMKDGGTCSIESIQIEFQGFLGMGNCLSRLYGL